LDSRSQHFSLNEERAIRTVTCLAAFLFFNSFGSIGVALPMIQKQFGNSLSEIQWIVLMGVVTISSLSFCFGRAGGIFGQRRLYKIEDRRNPLRARRRIGCDFNFVHSIVGCARGHGCGSCYGIADVDGHTRHEFSS
jgi:hypothetical protein